jgi:trimethylamine:corrinoid methyltransferase-like protein
LKANTFTEGIEDSQAKVSFKGTRTVRVEGAFGSIAQSKSEYSVEMFSVYITDLKTPRTT